MAYLGNTPTQQGFTPAIDYFSGNASTTAFTLSRPVASVAQVQAVIENVPQNPGDAFTVSGNTITFTSAPPSGTNNIYVYYTSPITTVVQPGQGTVGTAQLVSGLTVNFADGSASAPSITNDGDTNTGIFFPAADSIGFAEGGTEVARFDSNGYLLVGTTSPTYITYGAIEVNHATNSAVVLKTGNTAKGYLFSDSSSFRVSSNSTTPMLFETNGTERMRIDTSGNVGIGTSSPNAKLDVTGQILTGSTGNNAVAINSSGSNYGFISNPSSGVFALGYGTTIGTLGTSVATWNSSGNFGFNSGYGSVATAYGCRAWVNFNGTSTVSIRASGNVSSITDNGTGDYTLNFTNAMPDGNYCWYGSGINTSGTGPPLITWTSSAGTQSTTQLRIKSVDSTGANASDFATVNVAVVR